MSQSAQRPTLDAIRVTLSDALRPLADPLEIQSLASRILGEHLGASRVAYFEVRGTDYFVALDYVDDAAPIAGRYPINSFGAQLLNQYRSGATAVSANVAGDATLTLDARAAYVAIQVGAYVGVPLVKNGEFVAGLAVHARRPREWTAAEIALVEESAERTWSAVERARSEQALRESEERYRTLFATMDEGFCLCELLVDESGRPVDYRFLEVNAMFEQHTGLRNAAGKTARQLMPGLEAHWLELYGKVVLTGETARFEHGSAVMGRWFDVRGYRAGDPAGRKFAILSHDITAHRKAELKLRQVEQRFRDMADNTAVLLWQADMSGVTFVNSHYLQFLGTTFDRIKAMGWADYLHPEDVAGCLSTHQAAYQTHQGYEYQCRFRRHDGAYRWLHIVATPHFGADGGFLGLIGHSTDVTRLKEAELNTRFLSDLDKAVGSQLSPETIEQTTVELLGRHLGVSRCYFTHVHDNLRGVVTQEFRRPEAAGSVVGEHRATAFIPPERIARFVNGEVISSHDVVADTSGTADGEQFAQFQIGAFLSTPVLFGGVWCGLLTVTSAEVRAWRPDEQELVREVGARVWPLLERARAMAALRESKSRFDIVKDGAQVGFWFCDLPFNELIWDNRVKEHFWLPADAVVTIDTFYERLHPADRARTRLAIDQSIADRTQYDIEYRTVSRDGREKWIRAIGRTFYAADLTPVRFDGVTLDITDRKKAEAALIDADRRKDEFLAMLAHELRNPLAPIRNAAQVLKSPATSPAGQQWASDVIERQTQHITRLVDDLLDVSRMTQGKIALRRERIAVATVIERAVEAIRPIAEARGQALVVTLPAASLQVEGDVTRLVQVMSNLLSNASKFSDAGGRIAVTGVAEGDWAVLRVADNGTGIPREMIAQVFDLFTQADRSLDRSQGGLGIGLTLVRLLVDRHGGSVEARSEGPGRGSEFVVRLPLAAVDEAHVTAAPIEVPVPAAIRRSFRVLVVEDNLDSAEMLSVMLSLNGYQTEVANDGAAALDAARRFQPRVILCDIGLPRMNGYEVAQQLRDRPGAGQLTLVALTGYGQAEDRRRAAAAGFEYHLVKPVEPQALFALLDSLGN